MPRTVSDVLQCRRCLKVVIGNEAVTVTGNDSRFLGWRCPDCGGVLDLVPLKSDSRKSKMIAQTKKQRSNHV